MMASLAGSVIDTGGGSITVTGDWGKGASFSWPMTPAGAAAAAKELAAKGIALPRAWAARGAAAAAVGEWMVWAGAPSPKKARVAKKPAALKVRCPKCRAYPGMPCRSGSGYGDPHPARLARAA